MQKKASAKRGAKKGKTGRRLRDLPAKKGHGVKGGRTGGTLKPSITGTSTSS
jgi:hypothetical protein